MRQAIVTEYKGPTDTRGAHILVKAQVGRYRHSWDYSVGVYENHLAAVRAAIALWSWHGTWSGGGMPDGKSYVWVDAETTFTVP